MRIITFHFKNATVQEVFASAIAKGKLAADYWVKNSGVTTGSDYYADICSFYGACIFGDAQKDSSYYKDINSKYTRTAAIVTDNIVPAEFSRSIFIYIQGNLPSCSLERTRQTPIFKRAGLSETRLTIPI